MKNLFSTTALLLVVSISGPSFAYADTHGKDDVPSYLEETINQLPQQDAMKFRATMKEAHEKNMGISDQIHALHDDLDAIMAAEPFDQDAFRAKSAKLREVYETMRENTDDAFTTAAASLSQEERKSVATAMAYPHETHKAARNAQ